MKEFVENDQRIFIAGANGMVGSAIKKALSIINNKNKGNDFTLLTPSRSELDLLRSNNVENWFKKEKPSIVILAAAKV